MILYCDTSALVKLYILEAQSDAVKTLLAEAEVVAVCRIAWAEYHAALARRGRAVPKDSDAIDLAKQKLASEWGQYLVLEVTAHRRKGRRVRRGFRSAWLRSCPTGCRTGSHDSDRSTPHVCLF